MSDQFYFPVPGDRVSNGCRTFIITHAITPHTVIGKDCDTQEPERLAVDTLRFVGVGPDRELLGHSDDDWQIGQRRFQAVRLLIESPTGSAPTMQEVANSFGVHAATIYRWLKIYRESGSVAALIPTKPGPKRGWRRLSQELEQIIQAAIESEYLNKQPKTAQDVIDEVNRLCRIAKVDPPHANTVRKRIGRVPKRTALRRREGKDEAPGTTTPTPLDESASTSSGGTRVQLTPEKQDGPILPFDDVDFDP